MFEGTGREWGWLYKFGPTLNRRPKNQEDLNPEEDNCIGCSPRKAMTNIDSILRSRDIILPTKVYIVRAMVFPVAMYRCESWTIKKAECQRIDTFEFAVLEKTLESPLDCKEIQPVSCKGDQS